MQFAWAALLLVLKIRIVGDEMSDQLTNKALETLCNEILKAVEVKTRAICSQMLKKNKTESPVASETTSNEVIYMAASDFETLTTEEKEKLYETGVRFILVKRE